VVGLFGIPSLTYRSTARLESYKTGPAGLSPWVWLPKTGKNDMEMHKTRRNALMRPLLISQLKINSKIVIMTGFAS
jgi:hypothetical protein